MIYYSFILQYSMNIPLCVVHDRFEACILAGAIGDAFGSAYENIPEKDNSSIFYWGGIPKYNKIWAITDDTQLTLATCEALCDTENFTPELLAKYFLRYKRQRKLTGLRASTLKAIRELEVDGHWTQVGRTGDYAAGNGAAMRIAPLGYINDITRDEIRNICIITHRNDEAYVGALAVVIAIKAILKNEWAGDIGIFELLISQLPDTKLRDRLIEIDAVAKDASIRGISKLGNSGYVVDSIPFAIFSAAQVKKIGLAQMFQDIITTGGDTDTNASIAGQIAGSLIGTDNIPTELMNNLKALKEFNWIEETIKKTKLRIG